jgi:hypothetical protein
MKGAGASINLPPDEIYTPDDNENKSRNARMQPVPRQTQQTRATHGVYRLHHTLNKWGHTERKEGGL